MRRGHGIQIDSQTVWLIDMDWSEKVYQFWNRARIRIPGFSQAAFFTTQLPTGISRFSF